MPLNISTQVSGVPTTLDPASIGAGGALQAAGVNMSDGQTSLTVSGLSGLGTTSYRVLVDTTWQTTWTVTGKTLTGFVLTFSNPAGAGDLVSWRLL